jgi:hypothetical protein
MGWNSGKDAKIKAAMIIEVLGKPPEHLIETLNKLIEEIDKEKGVKVLSKTVREAQPLKDNPEFYTSFAEIEVELEEILYLVMLMFKYMPAHIEIISPETISLTNNGWDEILNELTRRLHGYDEVARVLGVEKNILERKLRDLMEKMPKEEQKSSPKSSEQDSKDKKIKKK